MDFIDLNNFGQEIQREFDYKIEVVIGQEEVGNYSETCIAREGGGYSCTQKLLNSYMEDITEWQLLDETNGLTAGIHRVSIWTDVIRGDHVDWIPTLYGERIPEWATWQDVGTDGLKMYWTLNETSAANIFDSAPEHLHSAPVEIGSPQFNLANGRNATYVNFSSIPASPEEGLVTGSINNSENNLGNNWTLSVWWNIRTNDVSHSFGSSQGNRFITTWDSSTNQFFFENHLTTVFSCSATAMPLGNWQHQIVTSNDTGTFMYVNGTLCDSNGQSSLFPQATTEGLSIGCVTSNGASCSAGDNVDGGIDEVSIWNLTLTQAQISAIAEGITFSSVAAPAPGAPGLQGNVTLEVLANNTISSTTTQTFISNSTVMNGNLTNSTINIWFVNHTLFTSVVNETSGHNLTNATSFTIAGLLGGTYVWNVDTDFNNDTATLTNRSLNNRTFTIDLSAPVITIDAPNGIVDYHKAGNNISIEYSITDSDPEFCVFEYDGVNTSIACAGSSAPLNITDPAIREIKIYANDSSGNSGTEISTWSYDIFERIRLFNQSIHETDNGFFQANVTFNNTAYTTISATMNYKSTSRSAGLSGSGTERVATSTFAIPTGIGSNTFNWSYVLTNATGTKTIISNDSSHNIAQTNLTECGAAPYNIPFVNFTFFNETAAQERVNATLTMTANFHLGSDASVNKTLSFTDATENPNYIFCAFPQNRTLVTNARLDYANGASPQRTFSLVNSLLTNVTTNVNLFLLPTSAGVFTSYTTIDTTSGIVTGVLAVVSRTISGVPTEITSGTTDGAGLITFFLNPDLTYDYVFSKAGFSDNSFSLQPNSPSVYVITMLSTAGTASLPGVEIASNLSFNIVPFSSNLSNQTTYTFGVNVTSGNSIGTVTLELRNNTRDLLTTISGSGVGFHSGTLNTNNHTRIIGEFFILSGNETITGTKIWTVGNFYTGEYSLERQAKLFLDYGFRDFTRILIILFFIVGIMIFMTRGETLDASESKIMVLMLLVWTFSLLGWLDSGLNTGANALQTKLARFGNQYGIAILTSVIGSFFILRRLFIRRI